MADPKRPSSKPAAAAASEPASDRAQGIDPKAVYVGGESLADRLLPHAKKFLLGLGALTVILAVYFTYRWWTNRKAEKATTALLTALNENRLDIKEVDPDDPVEEPDPDLFTPRTFGSEAERTASALAKLEGVAGSHRKAVALLEARLLIDAERAEDAVAVYQRTKSTKGLEGVLAREGLAYLAETAALELEPGDARAAALQNALELYRAAQPEDGAPRREVALYNEARMLALLGDKGSARETFERAIALDATSEDLESAIQVRLSQLDAKELPTLPRPGAFAPAPTPTPTPTPTDDATAPVTPADAGT